MIGGTLLGDDVKKLRIGQLAQVGEVSVRTIDYYTQIGLIKEVGRSPGNHRLYSEEALQTIRLAKEMQKQHYSLEEICHLVKGNDHEQLVEKIIQVRNHLDTLQKEVSALYPALQVKSDDPEVKIVKQDLVNKGTQVLRAMMILLGEPML